MIQAVDTWVDSPKEEALGKTIAVATNSRSMIFVTIVSCVRWCVCVYDPIYSGAGLRISVYV